MKSPLLYLMSLIAAMAAASTSLAADGNETGLRSRDVPVENTQAKKITPHSHPQEKLGIRLPQKASEMVADTPTASKTNAWSETGRHFHPRDAK